MLLHHLILSLTLALPADPPRELIALRARRAESITQGTLEYAVILIENDKIVTVGEDLPIERGIRTIDLPDGWVVMPGLVDAYSRIGMDGRAGGESAPEIRASEELYPPSDAYDDLLETGVTTLALYPPGSGIPGRAVVVRPKGDTKGEMIVADDVYLMIQLRSSAGSKKLLTKGFESVDKYNEKVEKAREKWEKEQEKKKKKKSSSKKKDDDKEKEEGKEEKDEKDEKDGGDAFVPPEPDESTKPFVDLLAGKLRALIDISKAGDYLHLLDAIDTKEFEWHLRIPMEQDLDIFYVLDKETYGLNVDGIGDRGCFVVIEPSLSLHPGTMRQRNLPNELSRAGARLVLIPRQDSVDGCESWLRDTGEIVATGLDREDALRAMTLHPAELLGLGDQIGSIDEGKQANLIILDGDPFEPTTRLVAVMLDGKLVHGEVER